MYNQAHLRVAHFVRSRFLGVPAATEVVPGWYLGGLFVDRVRLVDGGDDQAQDPDGKGLTWAAIVDLTCEFAERGRCHPEDYYHLPTWDGCPPDHTRFAEVGRFLAKRAPRGPVVVHCAYGVGRSTTVLCAALVVAGHFQHWEQALKHVAERRPIVHVNASMRRALDQFQNEFSKSG